MIDKDVIYRQEAIDAIMSEPPDAHYPTWYADILWKLPSAESRKKGKWIKKEPTIKELHGCYYECSKCHKFSLPFQKLNFCPNCGSYNGGEEE